MAIRPVDAQRLDVERLARDAGSLAGQWPLREFERLKTELHADAAPGDATVRWRARGEQRVASGESQIWLHLEAEAVLPLVCQRCLGPVDTPVSVNRALRFVRGEAQAAELDAQTEDDVLALARVIDLRELVEDELLLALPLVPRHEVCPLSLPDVDDQVDEAEPSPFAMLAALKATGRPS